jgi:predicted transcriptional regulator
VILVTKFSINSSVSSSYFIQHSMLGVRCSRFIFFSKPSPFRLQTLRPASNLNRPKASPQPCNPSDIILTYNHYSLTMQDMKTSSLTIRLDKDLSDLLTQASQRSKKNRSEIAREAIRRQLRLEKFEEIRKRVMPFAEARGYLTDEDIFSQIS